MFYYRLLGISDDDSDRSPDNGANYFIAKGEGNLNYN
ncbi:hypothetical protein M2273_004061 [Mucilaginibacter lappiensis]